MAIINLGRLGLCWKGVWNSGTAYVVDDLVEYEGSSYIVTTDNVALNPTDNLTHWDLVAQGFTSNITTADPTVNDDNTLGFTIGDVWVNTTTDNAWVLTDDGTGVANWVEITPGIDWSIDQGATDIHPGNYTDTNTNQLTTWDLDTDSNSPTTVTQGTEVTISGGTNIVTSRVGNTVTIDSTGGGSGGAYGSIITLEWFINGDCGNRWYDHADAGSASNTSPFMTPWDLELVGLSYTNENANVDADIEIYSVNLGDASSPKTLEFLWDLNDVRVATKTDFSTPVIVEAGDKVAIYNKDKGGNANDPVLHTFWKIVTATSAESKENYSTNMSTGSGSSSS